ncbi:hypothetical protein [Winogradskyella forsetii]|uniref:hypothetical protein n=1 Tax=Winogradskyella forsetii TaxID=2686077 RepID=UPI0015BEE4CF|nr:hypothetical protein [Winogradskyella forsetii]
MKLRVSILLLFLTSLFFTSCRKEETEFIEAPEDETLTSNSNVALLMQRTATNDGSVDNIVVRANCFVVAFPFTVNVNGAQITINSQDDYALIECVFEEVEDDNDALEIVFPITIILADFTEIEISNTAALNNYVNSCNGENVADDDIECLDFQYPITAFLFNSNNELLETIILENDGQLYGFIDDIDDDDIITIEFPITVILSDGSELVINNLNALEIAIENAQDTCDEDDDYDYNDDDCDDCTPAQVETLLTGCANWQVDKLERNATDYDDIYEGYDFNFFTDGTLSVSWNTVTVYGTWTASGFGNNLEVLIDVPSLPLCNNNWMVHEIENCSDDTKIDLRVGDDDRLRYENDCN